MDCHDNDKFDAVRVDGDAESNSDHDPDQTDDNDLVIEMSQDEIVWDESKDVDLRRLYCSPFPLESDDGNKSATRPSTTRNSPQFLKQNAESDSIRVNLNQTFQNAVKHRPNPLEAEREIDGILIILEKEQQVDQANNKERELQRTLSSPSEVPTQKQHNKERSAEGELTGHNSNPSRDIVDRAETIALDPRQRRRRLEAITQLRQQQHQVNRPTKRVRQRATKISQGHTKECLPHQTPTSKGSTSKSAKCDDFTELLEALKTPNGPVPSRPPLQFVNTNVTKASASSHFSTHERKADCKLSSCPPQYKPSNNRLQSTRISTFSPPAIQSTVKSQMNTLDKANSYTPVTKRTPHAQTTRTDHAVDANDDYDEISFTDNDLAQIDAALGLSLPIEVSKDASASRCDNPGVMNCVESSRGFSAGCRKVDEQIVTASSQRSLSVDVRPPNMQEIAEIDDDDDYGDFPSDVDFGQIDALITSQSAVPSASTILASSQPLKEATPSAEDASDMSDDFVDSLADFDFAAIDALVASQNKTRTQSSIASVPSGEVQQQIDKEGGVSFSRYTRYKVWRVVDEGEKMNTKKVFVASWNDSMSRDLLNIQKYRKFDITNEESISQNNDLQQSAKPAEDEFLLLCDEWYHTPVKEGDVVNLCSLYGRYRTDRSALPVTLQTNPLPGTSQDDMVLVLSPDMMMTPSIVSEASTCTRRAVLKARLGSMGLSSESALVGTLIHSLFQQCLQKQQFDESFAEQVVEKLLCEKAESLMVCESLDSDIKEKVLNTMPMIRQFAATYTNILYDSNGGDIAGVACHPNIHYLGHAVHSVEETVVSTELGLKGDIDVVIDAETHVIGEQVHAAGKNRSLMCLELKTGHNQIAHLAHMAQLSFYTFMLTSRYGTKLANHTIGDGTRKASDASSGGILLYLNDKSLAIHHVAPKLNEMKTLVSQRNFIANGLTEASRPRGVLLSYQDGTRENIPESPNVEMLPAPPVLLPDLKDSEHSCKRCFSNRECMLYAASGPDCETSSHRELIAKFTGKLASDDMEYFRTWDRLIDIEAATTNINVATAWIFESKIREEIGDSISGMTFNPQESSLDQASSNAIVCFQKKKTSELETPVESLGFPPGCNVIVSTDTTLKNEVVESSTLRIRPRMHLIKGSVFRTKRNSLYISCSSGDLHRIRDLVQGGSSVPFRVDKHPNSVGTNTLRWNLINFFTGDSHAASGKSPTPIEVAKQHRLPWLRDIVVRLKPPKFEPVPSQVLFNGGDCSVPGCSLRDLSAEFETLNDAQRNAVIKATSAQDYTLIQGLPGTGKSSTLTFLARLLVARGKRVLVTAYTHSAVDNIMLKLMEKNMGHPDPHTGTIPLVRVGNARSCHRDVQTILYTELAEKLNTSSIRNVVSNARIIGVSALSLPRSPVLQNQHFDVVIVDEAGQMNQPVALGVLMAADSFILVGDHKQLPPLVRSEIADLGGYGISMLSRLAEKYPSAIAPLNMQYRMNEEICKVSSEAFYGGMMKCGNDVVRSQRLFLPNFGSVSLVSRCLPWLRRIIDPQNPVVFVDTDNVRGLDGKPDDFFPLEEKSGGNAGGNIVNQTEAAIVCSILECLVGFGLNPASVGVISPFRSQVRILEENQKLASLKLTGLEVSTVDTYQGRDKSAIILCMVRSNTKGNTGRLLQDARRLNVALTRAKSKLIVVGSFKTLCAGSAPLKPILNRMKRRNQVVLLHANGFKPNS